MNERIMHNRENARLRWLAIFISLATTFASLGADIVSSLPAKAAGSFPDGTTLLMVHGFSDSCYGGFNATDSNDPTSAWTYLSGRGWSNIKEVGYYSDSHESDCDANISDTYYYGTVSNPGLNHCNSLKGKADGYVNDPINYLACLFAWYVATIYPSTPVTILAHSMGGLIVRAAIGESGQSGNSNYNGDFPTNPLHVKRVVTVGTPHAGITGGYQVSEQNLGGSLGASQEVSDMIVGSNFMNLVNKLQAPQGVYPGTYWALMAASDACNSTYPGNSLSCFAEWYGANDPNPDGDGVVQAASALGMQANFKILYGVIDYGYSPDYVRYTADANTQYRHELNTCAAVPPYGTACLNPPYYLNDATSGDQQTSAWICFSKCNTSGMNGILDVNPGAYTAIPALHSLAEIATLLAPPSLFTYAASNADGRMEVFAHGSDGNIWHIWQTTANGGWSSWAPVQSGWSFTSDPAVGINQDGNLEVFARGTNNAIYANEQSCAGCGWSGWFLLTQAYAFQGTPAVARNQDGRLELFARGSDGNIWHNYQVVADGGWSGWSALESGYSFKGDPQLGQNVDGRLEVFVLGNDNNVWHIWQKAPNSGWSSWTPLQTGTSFLGEVSVGRNDDGRLEVYAMDNSNNIQHNYELSGGGWSGWSALQALNGNNYNSAVGVGNNGGGRLELFTTNNGAGDIYHNFQTAVNGSWSGWSSLQTGYRFVDATPATANTYDGRLEVFAFGSDNNLYHNFVKDGGGWSGWSPLQSGKTFSPSDCANTPSDASCDNRDYIQQNCPDYPQETDNNGYVTITLHYSGGKCQSNWTSASIDGGSGSTFVLVKVDIERASSSSDGALTYTEIPSNEYSWYTNMVWAPNNQTRGCVWYAPNGINKIYGPYCTGWH